MDTVASPDAPAHRRAPRLPGHAYAWLLVAAGVAVAAVPTNADAAPWGFLVSADGKQRLPLEGAKVVVGGGAKAGARIANPTVAKRHATISHANGVVRVSDLGSRFGTLVAGTPLKKGRSMQLFKATKLTFGAATWTFEWGARGKLIQPLRKAPPQAAKKRGAAKKRRGASKRGDRAKPRAKAAPSAAKGPRSKARRPQR